MKLQVGAALLAAVAVLTGCAQPAPSAPTSPTVPEVFDPATLSEALFSILPAEEVWVQTTGDLTSAEAPGIRLHNAVFRPDTDEPVPVFINFSPYWEGRVDSTRPNSIRPAGVCSTLVTVICTSCPTSGLPCSTTTIVPSSR